MMPLFDTFVIPIHISVSPVYAEAESYVNRPHYTQAGKLANRISYPLMKISNIKIAFYERIGNKKCK
jgi:hypothetical protein